MPSLNNALEGRVPPQAIDVEEAVLGAIMLEKDAFAVCTDIISAKSFYKTTNQTIYSLISELNSKDNPIDMLTVIELAKTKGVLDSIGGAFEISRLCSKVASAAHIEFHARVVQEKYIAREARWSAVELYKLSDADSSDSDLIIDSFVSTSENLVNLSSTGNRILTPQENIDKAIARAKERSKAYELGEKVGIVPRLNCEQSFVTSYQGGELIIIAARPGMGKTSYVLSQARHFASGGHPGLIFALEMTTDELTDRNISSISGINSYKFQKGDMTQSDWQSLDETVSKIYDYPIYIDDTSNVSLNHIRKVSKMYKMKGNLDWIIIDYLQLMNISSDNRNYNREQEVGQTTRRLKALAKELNVPIFLLSQLNRGNENRPGKTPELSNLRESGAIEQDANIVILLHRPEYYFKDDPEIKGIIEIIFAKNRKGRTGTATAMTNENISEFYDLDYRKFNVDSEHIPEQKFTPPDLTSFDNGFPFEDDTPF